MESVLEQQRLIHEEIERMEQEASEILLRKAKTQKDKMIQEHKVKYLVEQISKNSRLLCDLYADEDGTRLREIQEIDGLEDLQEFYSRLKDIKDHFRKFPNDPVGQVQVFTPDIRVDEMFSGEEAYGRYLDLHEVYSQYINLKFVQKIDYITYLGEFDNFGSISVTNKKSEYAKYIDSLLEYFSGFCDRARPLFDWDALKLKAKEKFNDLWSQGKIRGWESYGSADKKLFCPACQKQFTNPNVFDSHLSGKKHLKAAKTVHTRTTESVDLNELLAFNEFLISAIVEELGDTREDSRANVERKQSRTLEEREEDLAMDDIIEEEEESEEEDPDRIRNPLKLPLDWDGKPIPFWLWKLHGLGVEFPCEVCGNYMYMGRRAFDRHFQEWRHSHGMKCLGIPNMKQFSGITVIEEVQALWQKLKLQYRAESFRPEAMEEIEDKDGNVYTRKTFEDLRRQGLV